MLYLLLAICFSASLPLQFKYYKQIDVRILLVVPINYLACAALGTVLGEFEILKNFSSVDDWVFFSAIQGVFFAGTFYLLAATAQRIAVSVASLSSRLSVAIPVVAAFFIYGDSLDSLKLAALICAGLSLYLATTEKGVALARSFRFHAVLPALLFISYGLNWTLLKYVQEFYLTETEHHLYVTATFSFAFVIGLLAVIVRKKQEDLKLDARTAICGALLGICNYLSVFFLVRALSVPGWESSRVYPSFGVGVVIVSSLYAYLLMSEKSSSRRVVGILIGLGTIVLLNS